LRIFTAEGTIITEDDNYAEEAFINCCRYKHVHSLRLGSSNFSRGWVDGMMTKLLNSKWDTVHYTTKHTTAPAITTATHIRSPRLKKNNLISVASSDRTPATPNHCRVTHYTLHIAHNMISCVATSCFLSDM